MRRSQFGVTKPTSPKSVSPEPFSAHPNPWSHPWDRVGRAAEPCPVGGTLSTTPVVLVVDVPAALALRGLLHGVTVDDGDPVPAAVFPAEPGKHPSTNLSNRALVEHSNPVKF